MVSPSSQFSCSFQKKNQDNSSLISILVSQQHGGDSQDDADSFLTNRTLPSSSSATRYEPGPSPNNIPSLQSTLDIIDKALMILDEEPLFQDDEPLFQDVQRQ